MINLSAWDSKTKRRFSNPDFIRGKLEIIFEKTREAKVAICEPASVVFRDREKLSNQRRNDIINQYINAQKYSNVSNVYTLPTVMSPHVLGGWEVYSHGEPKPNGLENCAKYSLRCKTGSGTVSNCSPGKCVIGRVEKIRGKKWKYTSDALYNNERVIYFTKETDSHTLELKTIIRGDFESYTSNKQKVLVNVTSPASTRTTIFVPPKDYYGDRDFIDEAIILIDERLSLITNPPRNSITGVHNRKDNFIQKVIIGFYKGESSNFQSAVTNEFRAFYLDLFGKLDEVWYTTIRAIVDSNQSSTLLDFISSTYDQIEDLFSLPIHQTLSDIHGGRIKYFKENIARPVYSRLPGIAEAYRDDPANEVETPSQWLVSGVDEFLSDKKDQIANFYYNSLNPDTCGTLWLDWLAQHIGLFGPLWDTTWSRKTKVALIKNAMGWWDESVSMALSTESDVVIKTQKGKTLEEFPFSSDSMWVDTPEDDTSLSIYYDRIESINLDDDDEIESFALYKKRMYNETTQILSLQPTNEVFFNKTQWKGLIPSKGSLICVAFLCSAFSLKAFSPLEVEILDAERKIVKPKSGLRSNEQNSPTLLPYFCKSLQVGTNSDLEINNFENQLVAGVSLVHNQEDTKNIVFRMPFYYNRNGKSWKAAEYIAKNWIPNNTNARVQYPYLCADLWTVGDFFFEPEITTS